MCYVINIKKSESNMKEFMNKILNTADKTVS